MSVCVCVCVCELKKREKEKVEQMSPRFIFRNEKITTKIIILIIQFHAVLNN